MASCATTMPKANTWKLGGKRPHNHECFVTGKSRKTSDFSNEKVLNKTQTTRQSPQRPLNEITREMQKPISDVDGNPSKTTRELVAVSSETFESDSLPVGSDTVTYVNNLFSPVNKLQAIPLTLDELRRRTEYPEFFGRSEMVAYLRHSKTTGNELISRYNLKSRSKRSKVNVLSRLCEREAQTLANGIHTMNSEYFPTDYVADTMKQHMEHEKSEKEESGRNDTEVHNNKDTVNSTISMLQNLRKSLEQPDAELAKDLEVFERATHTFGCQNIVNHISFVEGYLVELQKKL
ncbi:uncharacterized protein LOC114533668 [Dendronephthya gigantea]|uniref:uncharacterized protein LOC114533668 n=1 Tax=Dendronephthya gigantea TaxID=151771 RepID=UPI00106B7A5B|nr:uncharacterized protein LOC114533668 [Dendronephthya gigantea]XP_028411059.1 uncharacterized protein LOC114533668 [Dendronephthya gigantea]